MLPRMSVAALLLLLIGGYDLLAPGVQSVVITTPVGRLEGFHVDYGSRTNSSIYFGQADIFLGIPYVQPPTGQNRYKAPIPLTQISSTTYNATAYKKMCPQEPFDPATMDEDCLYLNVFTPNATSANKWPVMLWIHGGGLNSGSASEFHYKGAVRNLVSRGVVVVTIQYRLGIFGYFTTLTPDFPPNLGFLDQIETFKWVRQNIESFGGNPNNVTIFGESAGAVSVSAHLYSPVSRGLFQSAILESGSALTLFEGALGYDGLSQTRANSLCNVSDDEWCSGSYARLTSCMMGMTNISAMMDPPGDLQSTLGWRYPQDNYFMPDIPAQLAPQLPHVPILIGHNRDEFALYIMAMIQRGLVPENAIDRSTVQLIFDLLAGSFLGDNVELVFNLLASAYLPYGTPDTNSSANWIRAASGIFTSAAFTGFIRRTLSDHYFSGNNDVYAYEFTYPSQIGRFMNFTGWTDSVFHTAELPFVWAKPDLWDSATAQGQVTSDDIAVLDYFGEAWTNFAKFGKPFLDDRWPTVGADSELPLFMNISGPNPQPMVNYLEMDNLLWRKVLPILIGNFPLQKPYNGQTPCGPTEIPPTLTTTRPPSTLSTTPTTTTRAATTTKNTQGCSVAGYTASSINGRCYKIVSDAQRYAPAETLCEHEGAYLASVHSSADNSALLFIGEQLSLNVWLGAVCVTNETCAWTDGTPFDYRNFYTTSPDMILGKCLYMAVGGAAGQWVSADCSVSELAAVCLLPQKFGLEDEPAAAPLSARRTSSKQ